jgi:hypothetical protein
MEKFKFEMNGYKNICYVFRDLEQEPVDTLSLIETKNDDTGNLERGWIPQSYFVQTLLCDFKEDLDAVKEFYNENYKEICENLFPKDLLALPDKITGFYLQSGLNKISKVDEARHDNRFGVSYSEEQAKGMVAFCELSQILPIFNEGWNPDWNKNYEKWCIKTTNLGINVVGYNHIPHFLAFQTKKKAELFLKEKIDLITDLSNARII